MISSLVVILYKVMRTVQGPREEREEKRREEEKDLLELTWWDMRQRPINEFLCVISHVRHETAHSLDVFGFGNFTILG